MGERTSDIQDEKMEEGERKDAGDEERKDLEEEEEDAGQDEGRDVDVLMEKETDADRDTEQVILDKCENMETEVHKEDPDVDPEVDDDYDEEEEDDDVGWITPQNISQVRQQMGGGDEASLEGIKVGCMTTDFAMQVSFLE